MTYRKGLLAKEPDTAHTEEQHGMYIFELSQVFAYMCRNHCYYYCQVLFAFCLHLIVIFLGMESFI